MKWPTWELTLMLRMSPALSTFDGRQWLRQCTISGFWLDRSYENALKPGRGCGSLPRPKRRSWCPPGWPRGSHNHKLLICLDCHKQTGKVKGKFSFSYLRGQECRPLKKRHRARLDPLVVQHPEEMPVFLQPGVEPQVPGHVAEPMGIG
eukprot:1851652-Amphidinium_carterae.1